LETTEFGIGTKGFDNWLNAWRESRSHQFFLIGSKDETAGNQSCKAVVIHSPPTLAIPAKPQFNLSIKMPSALVAKGAPKFFTIEEVQFEYGNDQVLEALKSNTALSYRFHRDNHTASGWRVFASTDVSDATITSVGAYLGVMGVDFNADHLAWSRTDNQGNPVDFGRIDLCLRGKNCDQRDAILSEALEEVFELAAKHSCPIAIEDLDFSKKKSELLKLGVKRARMLSGLAYSKYRQLATSKASRLGVELILVNPAYTSVAGNVKYAVRLGCTVHQAAAGVIARRAQGYSEKLPKVSVDGTCTTSTICAPLMGHMAVIVLPAESNNSTRVTWVAIRRSLSRHCAGVVRERKIASGTMRRKGKAKNMHYSSETKVLLREPVELLDRRHTNEPSFPDVPF